MKQRIMNTKIHEAVDDEVKNPWSADNKAIKTMKLWITCPRCLEPKKTILTIHLNTRFRRITNHSPHLPHIINFTITSDTSQTFVKANMFIAARQKNKIWGPTSGIQIWWGKMTCWRFHREHLETERTTSLLPNSVELNLQNLTIQCFLSTVLLAQRLPLTRIKWKYWQRDSICSSEKEKGKEETVELGSCQQNWRSQC